MKWLLLLLTLGHSALATDVWYDDSEGRSPNGRFVATARSPENRKKNPRPFAKNFTFALTDTRTGKVLWRYNCGPQSPPPGSLVVSDTGAVISFDGYDGLSLFRPTGERVKLRGIFDLLPKKEVARFCDHTTAGIHWSQFSWVGFIPVRAKEFFYLRTYWGRILLVDVERGEISDSRTARRVVENQILDEARKALLLQKEQYWERCAACKGMHLNGDIKKSVFVLVQHKEKGREKLVKLINETEDGHAFDAKDYLPRLKGQ